MVVAGRGGGVRARTIFISQRSLSGRAGELGSASDVHGRWWCMTGGSVGANTTLVWMRSINGLIIVSDSDCVAWSHPR